VTFNVGNAYGSIFGTQQQAIREKLGAIEPDLPELPEPEAEPEDEDWLFDSRRDYLEQLDYYKDR
jgi:hypothetical protein